MPDAFDHATPEELDRLKEIDRLRDELTAERRRIWDRCRKRAERTIADDPPASPQERARFRGT